MAGRPPVSEEPPGDGCPPASGGRSGVAPGDADPRVAARRLARDGMTAVLGSVVALALVGVWHQAQRPGDVLLGGLLALPLLALPWARSWFRGGGRPGWAFGWRGRGGLAAVTGLLALVTHGPLIALGPAWAPVSAALAGWVLVVFPAPRAWALFCLVVAGTLGSTLGRAEAAAVAEATLACLLGGLALHRIARLDALVHRAHAEGRERAWLSVHRERTRFARDLHDLLGYSLSAITLKGELSYRLVPRNPELANEEIASLIAISRQALADMRMVSSRYRNMSMAHEAHAAAEVLAAANISTMVEVPPEGSLPSAADTLLATAVREGVANILRHSTARKCSITAQCRDESVQLMLVNDGVRAAGRQSAPYGGSGIENLAARLTASGGRVNTWVSGDRFHLYVRIPLRPGQSVSADRC